METYEKWDNVLEAYQNVMNEMEKDNSYIVIMMLNKFIFDYYPLKHVSMPKSDELDKKLTDLRIFNDKKEIRIFRSSIGKGFRVRTLTEDTDKDYFDEWQFLDIDDTKSKPVASANGCEVAATGGGCYFLPADHFKDMQIRIRNHIDYDENGHAYIKDWRLSGIEGYKERSES